MPQKFKEKWEIQVGRNKHIINGEEMEVILGAGENRFIRFRDLVINPAFIADMVLISKEQDKSRQLDQPEAALTDEEAIRNIKKIQELKELWKKEVGDKTTLDISEWNDRRNLLLDQAKELLDKEKEDE